MWINRSSDWYKCRISKPEYLNIEECQCHVTTRINNDKYKLIIYIIIYIDMNNRMNIYIYIICRQQVVTLFSPVNIVNVLTIRWYNIFWLYIHVIINYVTYTITIAHQNPYS